MDPSFTDSTTHPRKGKWTKPHKASRHDKRGPRMDPVSDLSENDVPQEAPASTVVRPQPVCKGPVPSLAAIYKEDGYQGYIDYLHADQCSCKDCAKQIALNQKWMIQNESTLEEAQDIYLAAKEREQEEREWRHWDRMQRHY
jgi:hypothetical protein